MAARATQERTLGSILGLGIGDAIGSPVVGMTTQQIATQFGVLDGYHARQFDDGTELKAGEFTDETEIALCVMETYTSANGDLDPDLIRARMQFLARGESRRWMNAETLRSLDDENDPWYRSPAGDDPEVAMRGIPIGIIHATPALDRNLLARDVAAAVGLTHTSTVAIAQATLVATAIAHVLAGVDDRSTLLASLVEDATDPELATSLAAMARSISLGGDLESLAQQCATGNQSVDVILTGIAAFALAPHFEDAVFPAASLGGVADARSALAGALAGAQFGAGGIPQRLIDQLEGRIYLTLAAPWFYRTIQLMTGRGITMSSNEH